MPFYTYSSSWRQIKKAWVYANSAWQPIKKGWVWVSNQWRLFFSGENVPSIAQQVTISQSAPDALDGLITLTGTNYHWTDFTSLTYYFEWSTDGGSTWTSINTGSITNPSSGSSNTKTYTVTTANTSPNIDNLYRFRVYAINTSLTNSSTSGNSIISTPRNITNVSASQVGNTLQASLSFTPGLYTNSIRVTTNRYNGTTFVSSSTTDLAAASPASVSLPAYNQTYKFQITPYTQTLISGNIRGYPGNQTAETSGLVIGAAPAPTQKVGKKPTLSNTGSVAAKTILTATGGEYDNVNGSISTRVYGWYPAPSVSDGTTTNPLPNVSSGTTSSFTTAQNMQNYVFYAVDVVPGFNGNNYYFFSTSSATVFLPSFTDNFNREENTTGSQGIGQTSGGSWYWSNDSVGTYGWQMPTTDTNNFSWEINNNTLYNTRTPSFFDNVGNYPMKSLDVGDSNVSISASIPDGGGGPGLVFWVTGAGSWWALAPSYYEEEVTKTTYPCTDGPYSHSSTTCPTTYPGSTTVGEICSCTAGSISVSYSCDTTEDGLSCPSSTATSPYDSTDDGKRCTTCTPVTITTCGSYGGACAGENCCPALSSADGGRCGACTGFKQCDTTTTFKVELSSGSPTLGTGCGDYCQCTGPFTSAGTSTCSTTWSGETGGPTTLNSCVTAADAGKICDQRYLSPGGPDGLGNYEYKYCILGEAASRYFDCSKNVCGSTYNTNQSATYERYTKVSGTTSVVNASYYKVTTGSEKTITYYSRIRILSASGSGITSQAEKEIATSTSGYQKIYGISVSTSDNNITAKAYSNTSLSTQMGTDLTFTAPEGTTKITGGGQSAVGIVNTPTNANRQTGNRLDNFTYTNV